MRELIIIIVLVLVLIFAAVLTAPEYLFKGELSAVKIYDVSIDNSIKSEDTVKFIKLDIEFFNCSSEENLIITIDNLICYYEDAIVFPYRIDIEGYLETCIKPNDSYRSTVWLKIPIDITQIQIQYEASNEIAFFNIKTL